MTGRKRKSHFLRALEARREAARQARQEPEGKNETEAPPSRILQERLTPLFPAKKRRRAWK